MNTIAIDFGSSRTKAAWLNPASGLPELLPLGANGSQVMPSLFYLPSGDAAPCVGCVARDYVDEDPAGVVRSLKRRIDDTSAIRKNGRSIAPVDLAAHLFAHIRDFAEKQVFHADVTACVLTVPVAFDSIQRTAIAAAARQGGFTEVTTIEEPVAAARWWLAAEAPAARDYVVVCDVGGGTTDIALLRKTATGFEPFPEVPPAGFNEGGNDVDDRIFELLGKEMETDILAKEGCRVQVQETRERFARDARAEIPLSVDGIRLRLSRAQVESCGGEFVDKVCAATRSFQQRMSDLRIAAPLLIVGGGRHTLGLEAALKRTWKDEAVLMWKDSDYATVLGAVPGVGVVKARTDSRTALLDQYREHLRFAWSDGQISDSERQTLLQKAKKMGLNREETEGAEREIIGHTLDESRWLSNSTSDSDVCDSAKLEAGIAKNRLNEDKLEEALIHASHACDLEPGWTEAFMLKGRILARLSKWPLAVVAFSRALELNPADAGAYSERGWCHLETGAVDAAWNDFHYACEFMGGPDAKIGRGFVYLKNRCYEEAFVDLSAALQLASYLQYTRHDPALLHIICAWLCQKRPQPTKPAIHHARTALQLWNKHEKKPDITEQLHRWADIEFTNDLGTRLQIWLWESCCEQYNGDKRLAAAHFLANDPYQAPEGFWQLPEYHEVSFYAACAMAASDDTKNAKVWLCRLFLANPSFDLQRVREETNVRRHSSLDELLKPSFVQEWNANFAYNHITLTNKSLFAVHEVLLTCSFTRITDGRKKHESIKRQHGRMQPGEVVTWNMVFTEPGWFGGNIEAVTFVVECSESR